MLILFYFVDAPRARSESVVSSRRDRGVLMLHDLVKNPVPGLKTMLSFMSKV